MLGDLRHALKTLTREPALALAMIAILGLGIGCGAAILTVIEAVLIRPLPFPGANRLVVLWQQDRTDKSRFVVSAANYLDWRDGSRRFAELAAIDEFRDRDFKLTGGDRPQLIRGVHVTPNLFAVLGVTPLLGRTFTEDENGVVVLSEELWKSRFGGDRGIVGKSIALNGRVVHVIGVMPARFEVPMVAAKLFVPIAWTAAESRERRIANYLILGKTRPGIARAQLQAELDVVATRLERQYAATNKDVGVAVDDLQDRVVGPVRSSLAGCLAAAALVFLLAAITFVNLLATRRARRQREIAIRMWLGATRGRIVRQFLADGLVLSLAAGLVGLALGNWSLRLFLNQFNETVYFTLPRRGEIQLDWRVCCFVLLISSSVCLVFSLAPALSNRRVTGIRPVLVAGQIAVTTALSIGATLLARSYLILLAQPLGFEAHRLVEIEVPQGFERFAEEAARLPGVISSGAVSHPPFEGVASFWSVSVPGRSTDAALPAALHAVVTPGYFETMKIPLKRGRFIARSDGPGATRAAVLSETAMRLYFPDEDPVGHWVRINDEHPALWQVVGVVGDVQNLRLDIGMRPQIYVPAAQDPTHKMTVMVRTVGDDASIAPALRVLAERISREEPVLPIRRALEAVDESSARWRIGVDLFTMFAVVALIVSLLAVYAATSAAVAYRMREIGIRAALGATPGHVGRLFLRETARYSAIGISVGVLLACWLGRVLSSLLFGVAPLDARTFAVVPVFLFALAAAAAWAASRRAARLDPAVALRVE